MDAGPPPTDGLDAQGALQGRPPPLRVLMVDDALSFCQMVGLWLAKEEDIAFRHCQDTGSALQVALEFKPDVIIQDMVMPGTDGIEMIRTYRRHTPIAMVPVIVLSADDAGEKKTQAFMAGADDYVRKNAERMELLARIRYHGRRSQAMHSEGLHRFAVVRGSTSHTIRLLVVEPSRTGQSVLAAALRREPDLDFRFCSDDRAALRLADEMLPTVIVVSLFGGSYDGFDLIRRLRTHRSTHDVPIIFFTSTDDPVLKARAFESDANDYAIRGNDLRDLVARVKRHSSRHFMAQQARFAATGDTADVERIRVLMVDNGGEAANAVSAMLRSERQMEFSVLHAPGRLRATIREQEPTLVLLNLDMQQVDGLELLCTVRDDAFGQALPVILMSAQNDPALKARAFALGADDHVPRNVDKIELVSRILHHARSHLSAKLLRRALEAAMHMERRVEVQRDFIRRTFGRYLSDGVVEAILDDPAGLKLGGETRVVTLMMTDLRGFTAMSEAQPPNVVIDMLNRYFEVMTRVLMSYEATIDEFVGDAIFAIFGAPNSMDDHAARAVACAIAMQNAMAEVNDTLAKRGLPELEMGIGINTGEVVVGNVGSERRTKYGVVGRHVNIAARIESLTIGGQILAAESTVSAARGMVRTNSRRQLEFKGIKGGVVVHDVLGIDGTHNLTLRASESHLVELSVPLAVRMYAFEGKQRSDDAVDGCFTHIGRRGGIVTSDVPLVQGDLQVAIVAAGGAVLTDDLFAKLVGPGPLAGTSELRFTSISPSVRAAIDGFTRMRR